MIDLSRPLSEFIRQRLFTSALPSKLAGATFAMNDTYWNMRIAAADSLLQLDQRTLRLIAGTGDYVADGDAAAGKVRAEVHRYPRIDLAVDGSEWWTQCEMRRSADLTGSWALFQQTHVESGGTTIPGHPCFTLQQGLTFYGEDPDKTYAVLNLQASDGSAAYTRHNLGDLGITPGQYDRVVTHIRYTSEPDGFARVWVNGQQKVSYTGKTCYFEPGTLSIGFGIYRDEADSEGVTPLYWTHQIRNFKVTRGALDVRF
ncbi:MAG: heparin lyase I family protein [Salipiger marinus]|uniref:heparin lyase I family protein n=1 Tax=Salipiger marinus TaxID=555512 RepID=UPI0040598C94